MEQGTGAIIHICTVPTARHDAAKKDGAGSWAIIHICTVPTARQDAAKEGWSRGPGLLYIFVPYRRPDMMLV